MQDHLAGAHMKEIWELYHTFIDSVAVTEKNRFQPQLRDSFK